MTAVISVRLKNVQFEGQTKTKLGNPEVKPLVEQLVSQKLDEFLNLKSSKSIAEKLWKRQWVRLARAITYAERKN